MAGMYSQGVDVMPTPARIEETPNTTMSKAGGRQQRDPAGIVPVTGHLLQTNFLAQEENPTTLYGQDIIRLHLTFVGMVEEVKREPSWVQWTVDDGTHLINMRKYVQSDDEAGALAMMNEAPVGKYARIVGRFMKGKGYWYVSPLHISAVTDPDEIALSAVEAAHAFVFNKQPEEPKLQTSQSLPTEFPTSTMAAPKPSPYVGSAAAGSEVKPSVGPAWLTPDMSVTQAVKEALKHADEAGLSKQDIKKLVGRFDEPTIGAALKQFEADGDVYTTIDDEHFALC